jgi:hypothetical protein
VKVEKPGGVVAGFTSTRVIAKTMPFDHKLAALGKDADV